MPVITACAVPRCPRPATDRGRCAAHRRTTSGRGYGITHQRTRELVKATLPKPCGYGCGTMLYPNGEWHLAHVVDGKPEHGYIAACVLCNERVRHGADRPVIR